MKNSKMISMKKAVLALLLFTGLFVNKAAAQPCSLANLQLTIYTGLDSKCYADVSFDMDRNNGNKFIYIHLWNSANYSMVNNSRWQWGSGPVYADINGSGNSHPALATIAIDNNDYFHPIFSSYGYRPDPTVSVKTGTSLTTSSSPVSGSGPHAFYRYTVTHVLLSNSVNDGCINSNINGIIWSTQANSQNSHIHCSIIGAAKPKIINGHLECSTKKYEFDINNDSDDDIDEDYKIYKDDDPNSKGYFDPEHDKQISSSSCHVNRHEDGKFSGTLSDDDMGDDLWLHIKCSDHTTQVIKLVFNPCPIFNPDINVTFVNVQIPGDVSTNDKVPAGTTYGTPTFLSKPAGSTATITMNSNGTYTFIANTVGVYTYNVPVCVPGQSAPCPPSLLTITVLGPNVNNPPVANTDFATTKVNTPVTLNSLANDKAGNPGGTLNPASVTVITAPLHGTTSVNTTTGAITYAPASGFTGMDTLTYRVCDNGTPSLCATAKQIIRVVAANVINTTSAADDYATTSINTPVSGNVKTNDSDPEGNTQTVTTQTITATGKGTLVLNADGTFTFTPVTGFTGPVSFVYTTCDNGVPQACANATLYITVTSVPDLTPRINLNPNNIIGQSSMEITVQVNELNNIPTNGSTITLYVDKQNLFSNFTFNSAQITNAAGQPVQNSLFSIDALSNPDFYVITTSAIFANSLRRVTFSVTVKPGQTKGSTPVNVFLKNGSGGETNFTNNSNFTVLTFSF